MRIVSTVALLIIITLSVCAQKFEYTYQGVEFKCKIKNRAVTITSFSIKASRVTIPAVAIYKGVEYPVKAVDVFLNGVNYLTETLVLEEGIEDIAKFSFNEFRKLRSITLPSTLHHVGRNAIRNNDGMVMHLASNLDEYALRDGNEIFPQSNVKPSESRPIVAQAVVKPNPEPQATKAQVLPVSKAKKKESTKKNEKVLTTANREQATKTVQPVSTPNIPLEDVDIDIPTTTQKNSDTYCVIIANEKYDEVPNVEYASHDGEVFKEYCIKTLGIPEKNIKMFTNATYTTVRRAVNWMGTTANVTGGRSKMIFYYAGHGIPGEKDRMAYILPTDGMPKDVETCYKLSELYHRLGKINAQNITILLDACFTGMQRGEAQPLVAGRAVAIETNPNTLSGNIIVFSATSGDETAMAYKEKRHGMFTYFLLNKLKETKGKVSLGDLFESVTSDVKKNSWLENEKLQTPSVNVSTNMRNKWKSLHL